MRLFHLCLKEDKCNLQFSPPPPFGKYKGCKLTQGECKDQGCKIIEPTTVKETDGRLIIDTIKGKVY